MEKYKRIVKDNYLEDIVGINVGIKKKMNIIILVEN